MRVLGEACHSAPWVGDASRQWRRPKVEIDEQTRRQLTTLGYIDDAEADKHEK